VLQRLQREADLLSKVSGCGNVGALRAVHESDDAAFVVLAFVDGGDLEALVTRRREEKKEEQERRQWEEEEEGKKSSTPLSPLLLSEREAAVVVFELLKALTALHSNLVLHGDIKPANIMLDASATRDALAGKWSRPFLRLADFGLGRACAAQQKVSGTVSFFPIFCSFFLLFSSLLFSFLLFLFVPAASLPLSPRKPQKTTQQRGTPVFMAPEVFRGSYGQKSDVFAAGVTLYYLLSDRYPYFETLEEVLKLSPRAVRARALGGEEAWGFDGSKEPFASWCSPSCRDLLSSLLDREEELRPTAFEALGHSWFREQLPPEPELLIREVEEQQRGRTGAGELEASSTAAFGLPSSSSSSSSAAADALSPPPLALPPGVAAVSAILAHASMSACSECEMACCPLSGTRLGGGGGGGGSGGSGGGGSGDGKSGGKSGGNGLSSAATSRLVEGAEGFLGGIDGRELTGLVHGVEPPEVDEH